MIRRELLNEVSRMTSNMYAALLAAKTTEERAAMFQRVNEIIWRLLFVIIEIMLIKNLLIMQWLLMKKIQLL